MKTEKVTPINELISQFINGARYPYFSYSDLPLGDYPAEITKICYDEQRRCICVTFYIGDYSISLQQMYFIEAGDNECLKFFNFLKLCGVQEILPDYLVDPGKSGIIGKKCMINVNVSGNQGRIYKNALFLKL